MAQTQWLTLKEITPDPLGFSNAVSNRLKRMTHRMAEGYLGSINPVFKIPYTSRLLLYIQNSDSGNQDDLFTFSPGNAHSPAGSVHAFLSETSFLSLDEEGKATRILEMLHGIVTEIARQTGNELRQIDEAHHHFLKQAFYYDSYPPYESPDDKYRCCIQSREKWECTDHRLAVTDMMDRKVKCYAISTTPHTFFEELSGMTEENKWDIILNTPQLFDPVYWEGKKFILCWGQDKYEFDPEKETIIRT